MPCGVDEWVHVNCAIWSAEAYEEQSGILRCVHTAISRGMRMVSKNVLFPFLVVVLYLAVFLTLERLNEGESGKREECRRERWEEGECRRERGRSREEI